MGTRQPVCDISRLRIGRYSAEFTTRDEHWARHIIHSFSNRKKTKPGSCLYIFVVWTRYSCPRQAEDRVRLEYSSRMGYDALYIPPTIYL